MLTTKKRAFGFGALIQKTRNIFKHILWQLDRRFGRYGSLWYFLGIQTLFQSNGYKNQWSKEALHYRFIYHFEFVTDTFLRFQWCKNIIVNPKSGHHLYDADKFGRKEIALCKELKIETEEVQENREFFLYSPWIIDSWYKYSAPDQRVVVQDESGDEEIETHKFDGCIQRRKLPWWNGYRIQNRSTDDMTEFDRAVDRHVMGGY